MLVKRQPVNVVQIILELRMEPHRMTFREIGEAIGVPDGTVKSWFFKQKGHRKTRTPRLDDALALLDLHRLITEKGANCNQTDPKKGLQSEARPREFAANGPNGTRSATMVPRKPSQPKAVKQPGEEPGASIAAQEPGKSDPDAAIAQARAGGGARRIAKPRAAVPPAKVKQVDEMRPKAMPVNQKTEMSYEDAMALHRSGEQTRAILTPQGWVAPPDRTPERAKMAGAGSV